MSEDGYAIPAQPRSKYAVRCHCLASQWKGTYGLVDLLCSPNAHTRMRWISLVSPCARGRDLKADGRHCLARSEPQFILTAWLRKLGPSWTMSERTFEQCVSPSPPGKRARPWVNDCEAIGGLVGEKDGAGLGRVRMATAVTNVLHPSQVAVYDRPPHQGQSIKERYSSGTRRVSARRGWWVRRFAR
jgi:hypothetical protein